MADDLADPSSASLSQRYDVLGVNAVPHGSERRQRVGVVATEQIGVDRERRGDAKLHIGATDARGTRVSRKPRRSMC